MMAASKPTFRHISGEPNSIPLARMQATGLALSLEYQGYWSALTPTGTLFSAPYYYIIPCHKQVDISIIKKEKPPEGDFLIVDCCCTFLLI